MLICELKGFMAKKGVSQRELAKRTGINRNTLAGKMSGRRPFDVEEARMICDALEITNPEEQVLIFFGKTDSNLTQSGEG